MRLIALRFQGIGPYRDEFSIDFTALSKAHMFLIEGETGAGKTTILDAIVFALYGETSASGANAQRKDRLRSKFLYASTDETYVDVVFSSNGDYYRVRRNPEYNRPALRGGGITQSHAKGKLWKLDRSIGALIDDATADDGSGALGGNARRFFNFADTPGNAENLSIRVGEITGEIERLLGLNREQFSRTIMLAQGEFSRFLREKPEERTALLKDLFGAHIYEDIQKDLGVRRLEAEKALANSRSSLAESIGRARSNAASIAAFMTDETMLAGDSPADGVVDDDAEGVETDDTVADMARWGLDANGKVNEPAWSAEQIGHTLRQTLDDVARQAAAATARASRMRNMAAQRLEQARATCQTVDKLAEATDKEHGQAIALRDLTAQTPRIDRIKEQLDQARRAKPVMERQRDLETGRRELEQAERELSEAKDALAAFEPAEELAAAHAQALTAAQDGQTADAGLALVKAKRDQLDRKEQARCAKEDAVSALLRARQDKAEADERLAGLPAAKDIAERRQDIAVRIGERPHLEEAVDNARKTVELVRERLETAGKADDVRAQVLAAASAAQSARDAHERAKELLDQSGAAKYAERLQDGKPCPVCGSVTHPHPAAVPDDVPTAKVIREFAKQVKQREQEEQELTEQRTRLEERLRALDEQTGGMAEEAAVAAVGQAEAKLHELDGLDDENQRLAHTLQAIEEATDRAAQLETACAKAEADADAAERAWAEACRGAEDCDADAVDAEERELIARKERAREQADEAERLETRMAERAKAERAVTSRAATAQTRREYVESARTAVGKALADNGFDTVERACAAALEDAEANGLEEEADRHHRALSETRAVLRQARATLAALLAQDDVRAIVERLGVAVGTGADAAGEQAADIWPVPEDVESTSDKAQASSPVAYTDEGEPTAVGRAIASIDRQQVADAEHREQEAYDRAAEMVGQVGELARARESCAQELKDWLRAWCQGMERYEPLAAMAALASGNSAAADRRKVTLITYAVTERFRDVLDQANDILRDIHDGVYELRMGAQEGRIGTKTGLPIAVFDRRTEQMRDPITLSGGETFFVSLALALGLARTIQAENGGISMDTLFIDEGFGTLSDDYLEDVVNMLRGISRHRDVGIISHVGALKDQIPERIRVWRVSREGESRLEVIA